MTKQLFIAGYLVVGLMFGATVNNMYAVACPNAKRLPLLGEVAFVAMWPLMVATGPFVEFKCKGSF